MIFNQDSFPKRRAAKWACFVAWCEILAHGVLQSTIGGTTHVRMCQNRRLFEKTDGILFHPIPLRYQKHFIPSLSKAFHFPTNCQNDLHRTQLRHGKKRDGFCRFLYNTGNISSYSINAVSFCQGLCWILVVGCFSRLLLVSWKCTKDLLKYGLFNKNVLMENETHMVRTLFIFHG